MKNDVSKKRKKTSKEKRVLVASLGIAAVVAAGSTFAWFTSQDEVTNRLSANAAYDVSVIETFTPPTNWIPGQRVNKDTSAVNTGNIPAFVKQKLEGKIQVTLEQAENKFDIDALNAENATPGTTKKKKYVELSEDEVDVIEAGGFLAYAFNTVIDPATGNSTTTKIGFEKGKELTDKTKQCYLGEVSAVHSGKNFDLLDPEKDINAKENANFFGSDIQFVPPATGDYIFRRVINVDNNPDSEAYGTETYEYKGYHYEAETGKYYQIKVINGLQTGEDGILQDAPNVYYGVEVNDIRKLPLRYEAKATKKYLLYTPVGSEESVRVGYTSKTESVVGSENSKFDWYSADNGAGGTDNYFVCRDKGSSCANVGDVYTNIYPVELKNYIGTTSGVVSEYDIEINTPDRLVATYEVAKSDDVFIGNPTDLSDFTADNYDAKRAAIAKSDYLLAKVAYENEKAQYELNKKAYETGVALLDALAKNEKILAEKQKDIQENAITKFTGSLNSNLTFTGDAANTPFTTGATSINDKLGTVDTNNQLPKVTAFINAINTYKANPTDVNWDDVVTKYDAVNKAFTDANSEIIKLEETIVTRWKEATLDNTVNKMSEVLSVPSPANASVGAIRAKAAAEQLTGWEGQLAEYQNSVSAYFADLSKIQDKDTYKLLDLSQLNNAYEEAAIATVKKKGTNAEYDTAGVQRQRATSIIDDIGETIGVKDNYKIKVDTTVKNSLDLNSEKNVPIKNSISDDGYAGTAEISGITGTTQFTIGGNAIGAQTDDNKPSDADVNTLATAYEEAKKTNDKYQTEHTNQHANDDIVIYINLANIYDPNPDKKGTMTAEQKEEALKNKWKLTPTLVPGAEEANFYYTSILGGGEVSSILVDSVELSGDTTNVAFKEFDFDLNVTVDSAQVVVSEDGRFYESTAVNANPEFKSKPSKHQYPKESDKEKPVKKQVRVDWN